MKVVAINSSPKGQAGNTNVLVSAFLKGAREAGAETINIFLAEKQIEHCKGCHTCWSRGPGQCVTSDDMQAILSQLAGANVIVFATPVYFGNISGMLKVFMDRMTMIGGPQSHIETGKEHPKSEVPQIHAPKLMMISSCGFPDRDEFEVVSLWMKRVSQKMHMELVGEIFATRGRFLASPPEELRHAVAGYLQLVERAGAEIASQMRLSEDTEKQLARNFA